MSIEVDEDLELRERQVAENGLVRVAKGTGTPFNIKLKPRSVTNAEPGRESSFENRNLGKRISTTPRTTLAALGWS